MTTVVTALGHHWESQMVELVDGLPGVEVGRRCVDLADLLAAVSAGHGDVVLVDGDLRGLDRDALAHLEVAGVHVVGATRDGDEGAERRLRQLGLTKVVHLGTPREQLADVLATPRTRPSAGGRADLGGGAPGPAPAGAIALDSPPAPADAAPVPAEGEAVPLPEAPVVRGRVIAVWGPTGAPGRTTVAVNLAAELAASGRRTLLVDLDTYGASVAQALSMVDEAPGVAAAARSAELGSLDLVALARVAPEAAPGLRVLSGIPTPSRWTELRGPAIEHVLELSRELADVIVVDCGFCIEDDEELSYDTVAPRRNATTLVALEAADDLVVVGSADPVGLQRLVRAVQALDGVPAPAPRTVVNRVRASSVGPDPRRRVADSLARFAGLSDVVCLPDDPAAADASVLEGRTLAEVAPGSPLRAALRELAESCAGAPATRRHQRAGRRLLRR